MRLARDIEVNEADPLSVIAAERAQQYRICDDLERLADQLGGPLDIDAYSSVTAQLQSDLPIYHRDEEALFELMMGMDEEDRLLANCIGQAVSQHAAIQAYVFELSGPLIEIGKGVTPRNLDTFGYMLRYCFDGVRQHLQWEDVSIFREQPDAGRAIDRDCLRQAMLRNRAHMPRQQGLD